VSLALLSAGSLQPIPLTLTHLNPVHVHCPCSAISSGHFYPPKTGHYYPHTTDYQLVLDK
jgi:hypothetical protein